MSPTVLWTEHPRLSLRNLSLFLPIIYSWTNFTLLYQNFKPEIYSTACQPCQFVSFCYRSPRLKSFLLNTGELHCYCISCQTFKYSILNSLHSFSLILLRIDLSYTDGFIKENSFSHKLWRCLIHLQKNRDEQAFSDHLIFYPPSQLPVL